MKDSHYRISLDIHSTQSQVSLPVKQGDTSRKVFISLCEGGKPYQIEKDCYAVFSAKKPDGTLIENYCIIAGNVIEYTFTEQTTAVGGMLNCEIKLYGGDSGLITSPRFTIIVDSRAVGDAETESTSEYSALTNLYTTTTAAITRAENATNEAIDAKEKTEAVKEETQAVKEATEDVKTEVEIKLANGEFKGDKGDKGDPADYNIVSNALKGSAFGTTVRIDDVSPVEHAVNVKAHGKNLLDSNLFSEWFDKQADGSYLSNTEVPATRVQLNLPEGVYTLSVMIKSPQNKNYRPMIVYTDGTGEAFFKASTGEYIQCTGTTNGKAIKAIFFDYSVPSNEVQFKNFQIELGTTATEYVPYVDPTTVTVSRYGKNLVAPFTESANADAYGVTISITKDEPYIVVNGTATMNVGRTYFQLKQKPIRLKKGVTYTLSSKVVSGSSAKFAVFATDVTDTNRYFMADSGTSCSYSPQEDMEVFIGVQVIKENTYQNQKIVAQLEYGTTASEYESFVEVTTHTPNADGTVEGVKSVYPTMTLFADKENVSLDAEYNKDANKVIAELISLIQKQNRISYINLVASKWQGSASPYSQVVAIDGATKNSFVEFCFSTDQIETFKTKDITFTVKNDNGVITVNCVGQKPTADYRLQVKITEVQINE